MKLSIIIPYHNADLWVGAMLDSLLDQDLPRDDYEILVIDDGSTEEPVTLHRYAAEHPNIHCHRQENAGPAVARNTGLELAKGEWIWFCDSDDSVQPQILGRLLAIADALQLDMLWLNAVYVREGQALPAPRNDFDSVSAVQTGWDYVVHPPAKMGMAAWRYLVCRERILAGAVRFPSMTYVEVRWFQMKLMPYIRRVAHVDVDAYYYVQRGSSLLHAKKRKNYQRFAAEMEQYIEAMAAQAGDPSVPEEVQSLLRQRADFESYRLLGNLSRYGDASSLKAYYAKLQAVGTLPLKRRGGSKERLLRWAMNHRGLWVGMCRLYHKVRPSAAAFLAIALVTLSLEGCGPRVTGIVQTKHDAVHPDTLVLREVPNEAFYKDIFLDAGIGLTPRTSLHAADSLGLSLEGVSLARSNPSAKEKVLQQRILAGDSLDWNGRLLYPDGQPRYRVLFVNGGSSKTHGRSLGDDGLQRIRTFVENGGSYVGTCAGAFLAACGYDEYPDVSFYLALWPGVFYHTGLNNVYTGMRITADSPLLAYEDFGGDRYINSIRHNLGCYSKEVPEGTEILASFDYPAKKEIHKQPSAWAYKRDSRTGRLVLESSHPEEASKGERLDFTKAMICYALDGLGTVSIKGLLANGEPRVMDMDSRDGDPDHTRIGDRQCHHFAVRVPEGASDIRLAVESPVDCDLQLRLRCAGYAFPTKEDFASEGIGAKQTLSFDTLEAGVWYVSVQCLTTVTVVQTDYGQEYTGRTDVLNGFPYTITVSWNEGA